MRALLRRSSIVLTALILVTPAGVPAAAKPRIVLVLPFVSVDLGRDESWVGDAVAQSLMLALVQAPGLVQVERERLKGLPRPEAWDEPSALSAARQLRADVALFGEVRQAGGQPAIHARWIELKGDRVERGALEVVGVAEGALMERLRALPVAYVRALKVPVTETEVARLQKWAAPTALPRAFEYYVRGRLSWYRGGQESSEAAIEFLSKAVEADPQFVAAQFALGAVHQTLGNRWKAAAQYRASTQIDPGYPEPYKALGDLFLTAPRRLFDQAVEAYQKALEIRPFFAEAHVGLGDAKAAKGDVDGAVAAYQKALGFNPVNARVHVSLGRIYFNEKNLYYEAVAAYKKGIELDPAYLEARMGLAEVYEDKGLYKEAIDEYQRVVEADPKNTGALYNLALVHEKVDPREAIVLWERYIAQASSNPQEKDWVDVARLHLRKLRRELEKEK